MNKTKIFISAYACEPGLGSEIGVGWHWVLEMSKYFDLWVLTRKSNQYSIESWIAEHSEYNRIHFLYYDWPRWARCWKKGLRGVRTYYNIWQWCTNGIVKRTMQENNIKIFHHLTYGNVLWTVSRYGQKQFFIWGPAGGVETIPAEYSKHYPLKIQWVERIRRRIVGSIKFNRGFKKRCRNADLILCKTEILCDMIPVKEKGKAVLFTDVAVDNMLEAPEVRLSEADKVVEYITVGRLDPWRGFDLIVEAFALAVKKNKKIHLTIIGKGADRERLQSLIAAKRLEGYITMVGAVSMEQYYKYMQQCDVVVNASLKEGAVTVSFDSMAMGKPLICIDTTGYTRYFSSDYAVLIERRGRMYTIEELNRGILLLTDARKRYEMGQKAQQAGNLFTWKKRGEEIYQTIITALQNK